MCGRYQVYSEEEILEMRRILEEISRKFRGSEQLAAMKTGEIFPTNLAPVVSASGPEIMKWGFPMQGKSQSIINAKSETALERPMFRSAALSRRIAVPTTGFYEWTHEGGKTMDKYLFRLPHEKMLYLAGFYTEFNMPTGKETRFTILTTAANDSMKPFHHRMPVYVADDEIDTWIRYSSATEDIMLRKQPPLKATLVPKKEKSAEQMTLF